MGGVVGGAMQNQQQTQQQQWFNKQQQLQQQAQQQQQQQNQPILIQRQIPGMGVNNMQMGGPANYMARPRQPQMGGMNQGGYQNVFNAEQQQQQQQQQGMKPNQTQQAPAVSVLSSQLQGGSLQHQVVMGPPGSQHAAMQQQMMQNVRSPPPIASPQQQAQPSPRPAPSPRAQPSPHHMTSHSPGGDMHNNNHHTIGHPHQSPLPAMNDGVMGDNQLNAQEQLSKFVEKL